MSPHLRCPAAAAPRWRTAFSVRVYLLNQGTWLAGAVSAPAVPGVGQSMRGAVNDVSSKATVALHTCWRCADVHTGHGPRGFAQWS